MKKFIFILSVVLISTLNAFAQNGENHVEYKFNAWAYTSPKLAIVGDIKDVEVESHFCYEGNIIYYSTNESNLKFEIMSIDAITNGIMFIAEDNLGKRFIFKLFDKTEDGIRLLYILSEDEDIVLSLIEKGKDVNQTNLYYQ